jgi:hypothetical protein
MTLSVYVSHSNIRCALPENPNARRDKMLGTKGLSAAAAVRTIASLTPKNSGVPDTNVKPQLHAKFSEFRVT